MHGGTSAMRLLLIIVCLFIFSACDTIYVASRVQSVENPEPNQLGVKTIPMTLSVIEQANKSTYRPKKIPEIFRTKLVDPIYDRNHNLGAVRTILPEDNRVLPYRLGVGDVVEIVFNKIDNDSNSAALDINGSLQTPELKNSKQQVKKYISGKRIRDDGSVHITRIGRTFLAGKTLSEAEDTILNALLSKQIDPDFTFDVIDYGSQTVTVNGAVVQSGILPIISEPLSLLDAIQMVGGTKPDSITGDEGLVVYLYRDGSTYQIAYDELKRLKKHERVYLKDRDNISVENAFNSEKQRYKQEIENNRRTETQLRIDLLVELNSIKQDYVYVAGSVNKQSRVPLPFEQKAVLADALYSDVSQGIEVLSGNPSQLYVLRADYQNDQINAYYLNAKNAADLVMATQFELRPKDIIFVGLQPITRWNRALSLLLPSITIANAADGIGN